MQGTWPHTTLPPHVRRPAAARAGAHPHGPCGCGRGVVRVRTLPSQLGHVMLKVFPDPTAKAAQRQACMSAGRACQLLCRPGPHADRPCALRGCTPQRQCQCRHASSPEHQAFRCMHGCTGVPASNKASVYKHGAVCGRAGSSRVHAQVSPARSHQQQRSKTEPRTLPTLCGDTHRSC